MDKLELPTLPTVLNNKIVTVPSEDLQKVVDTVNALIDAVNAMSPHIGALHTDVDTLKENMSKVATILEVLYEKT